MQRVLLVEDNELVRTTITMQLRSAGFAVDTAEDVAQGLQHLQHGGIDVIVVDQNLPDGRGLDLLRVARNICPDCPIGVLSGDIDAGEAAAALRAGAAFVLTKPVETQKLLDTLNDALFINRARHA